MFIGKVGPICNGFFDFDDFDFFDRIGYRRIEVVHIRIVQYLF